MMAQKISKNLNKVLQEHFVEEKHMRWILIALIISWNATATEMQTLACPTSESDTLTDQDQGGAYRISIQHQSKTYTKTTNKQGKASVFFPEHQKPRPTGLEATFTVKDDNVHTHFRWAILVQEKTYRCLGSQQMFPLHDHWQQVSMQMKSGDKIVLHFKTQKVHQQAP